MNQSSKQVPWSGFGGNVTLAVAAAMVFLLLTACIARAQESDLAAMRKLMFLSGSWTCTVKGGDSSGLRQTVRHTFSPDGLWMTELSQDSGTKSDDWATQMWGYDAHVGKLVAYNFGSNGVFTKSVDGWVNGVFTSRRDDNGTTVSLRPVDARSIEWLIESADHSHALREECLRQ
jgi:hypothetical protein